MRSRGRNVETEESGWISMCDLLLLLFALGLFAALLASGIIGTSKKSEAARAQALADAEAARLKAVEDLNVLKDEVGRLTKNIGEWNAGADASGKRNPTAPPGDYAFGDSGKTQRENCCAEVDAAAVKERLQRELAADAERERDAAAKKVATLEKQVQELLEKSITTSGKLDSTTKGFDAQGLDLSKASDDLAKAKADLEKANADAEKLREKEAVAQAALAAAKVKIDSYDGGIDGIDGIAPDVLGIEGKLGNVVFVVDRSGSMHEGGRWEEAKQTITAWIKHFPVDKSVLVVFGNDVKVIPSRIDDGKDQELDSRELPVLDDATKIDMLAELNSVEPQGITKTYRAMWRAMQFRELDAIILFTDGAPENGNQGGGADPAEEVLELARSWKENHPNARVHTVGIGDYFNPRMQKFLLGLADATGGTFIGR